MNSKSSDVSFDNELDATLKLLDILPKEKMKTDDWIVVSPSLNAVQIVNKISEKLNLPYDLLFCEQICAPNNQDCIIGMVSETKEIVLHTKLVDSFGINLDFIYAQAHRQYEEKILPKVYKYRKGDFISSFNNKNVLLVEEGCETGMTIMTAAKTVINGGAKSVSYATPLISADVATSLEPVIDEIFAVNKITNFVETEFYYEKDISLNQDLVLDIISNSKHYLPFAKVTKR